MSARDRMLKKIKREVRKEKAAYIDQIAKDLLNVSLWNRIKLAYRIVVRGKILS